jgi:hypothetical protein
MYGVLEFNKYKHKHKRNLKLTKYNFKIQVNKLLIIYKIKTFLQEISFNQA